MTIRVGIIGTGVIGDGPRPQARPRHLGLDRERGHGRQPRPRRGGRRRARRRPRVRRRRRAHRSPTRSTPCSITSIGRDARRVHARLHRGRQARPVREAAGADRRRSACRSSRPRSRTAGGSSSSGYMRRYDPGYRQVKASLDGGAIGEPLILHNVHRNPTVPRVVHELHDDDRLDDPRGRHHAGGCWARRSRPSRSSRRSERRRRSPHLQDPQFAVFTTEIRRSSSTVEFFANCQYGYDVRCELVGSRRDGVARATRSSPRTVDVRASTRVPVPPTGGSGSAPPTPPSCRPGSAASSGARSSAPAPGRATRRRRVVEVGVEAVSTGERHRRSTTSRSPTLYARDEDRPRPVHVPDHAADRAAGARRGPRLRAHRAVAARGLHPVLQAPARGHGDDQGVPGGAQGARASRCPRCCRCSAGRVPTRTSAQAAVRYWKRSIEIAVELGRDRDELRVQRPARTGEPVRGDVLAVDGRAAADLRARGDRSSASSPTPTTSSRTARSPPTWCAASTRRTSRTCTARRTRSTGRRRRRDPASTPATS